ncbi:hypothetical protein RISK_000885 [Rhodopirellula islandica]|uniref:Uncharacterized protein n=2 Tax=Rhodopirellula islandica TaxID=595434 RepID=A0A0J1ENK0_RHOIS|nr:hypothetical protein RISK_000885 [Rhodopirellula islandica]
MGSRAKNHGDWGLVGERGETKIHKCDKNQSESDNLLSVLAKPLGHGYAPLDEDDFDVLLIEYAIEGMGSKKDLSKRHALEDRMNETLGWTGLGHCDGGSIGSGTMETCCIVVDFEIAKRVIAADLAGTKFADFTQIILE